MKRSQQVSLWISLGLLWAVVLFQASGSTVESSWSIPPSPAAYEPQTPRRVLDTRGCNEYPTQWCRGRLPGGTRLVVDAGVPEQASAAAVNVTLTDAVSNTFLTAWQGGAVTMPPASLVNTSPDRTVANFALIPLADDGTFTIQSRSDVHVIVDVMGFVESVPSTRTVTVEVEVAVTGPIDLSTQRVTVWVTCLDRLLDRVDHDIRQDVQLRPGATVTTSFLLPHEPQTNCSSGVHPSGGGDPPWYAQVVNISKTINGVRFPDGASAECLIPSSDGNYRLRAGDGAEFLGNAPPTGCSVAFTLETSSTS